MSKHTKPSDSQRFQKSNETRSHTGQNQQRPGENTNLSRGSQFQQNQNNHASKFQNQTSNKPSR